MVQGKTIVGPEVALIISPSIALRRSANGINRHNGSVTIIDCHRPAGTARSDKITISKIKLAITSDCQIPRKMD